MSHSEFKHRFKRSVSGGSKKLRTSSTHRYGKSKSTVRLIGYIGLSDIRRKPASKFARLRGRVVGMGVCLWKRVIEMRYMIGPSVAHFVSNSMHIQGMLDFIYEFGAVLVPIISRLLLGKVKSFAQYGGVSRGLNRPAMLFIAVILPVYFLQHVVFANAGTGQIEHYSARLSSEETKSTVGWSAVTGGSADTGTTASTNGWVDSTNLTVGEDYLVMVWGEHNTDGTTGRSGIRVAHGGTAFTESQTIEETDRTSALYKTPYYWFTVWTAVSGEDLEVEYYNDNGADMARAEDITLLVINAEDLQADGDLQYDIQTAGGTLDTSFTSKAGISWTPSGGGDTWWVSGYVQGDTVDVDSDDLEFRLNIDSGTIRSTAEVEGEDANDTPLYGLGWAQTFTAASHTVDVDVREDGANMEWDSAGVFALRLDRFEDFAVYADAGDGTTISGATTEQGSIDPSVTTSGDWLLAAGGVVDDDNGRVQCDMDLSDSALTDLTGGWQNNTTDLVPMTLADVQVGFSTGSKDVDFDCERTSGIGSHNVEDRWVVGFSMEEATPKADVDQAHFRWRDDSSGLDDDSGWLAAEDSNSIGDISKSTTYRIRLEAANTDTTLSADNFQFRLEYASKSGSCSASTGWTRVDTSSDAFTMVDSGQFTDEESVDTSRLTADETTYVAGDGNDSDDTSGVTTVGVDEYTEMEYSFQATSAATDGQAYCFRMTNAGDTLDIYTVYPEVIIASPVACGGVSAAVTVERTGSASSFTNSNNSSFTSVTVPADAEIMVVGVSGYYISSSSYYSGGTVSIDGNTMEEGALTTTTNAAMGGLWYYVNPPTGTQTLAWDWQGSSAPDNGNVFIYGFYKNIDTSAPIADSDVDEPSDAPSATTKSMTITEGDGAVLFGGGVGTSDSWTNATEITDDSTGDGTRGSLAEAFLTSNSTFTYSVTGGGVDFAMVSALILSPAPAIDYSDPCLTVDGYVFENDDGSSPGTVVARTGSVGTHSSATNNSSTSITVPSDATLMVLAVSGWEGTTTYFSGGSVVVNGNSMTYETGSVGSGGQMGALWYIANPSTGSQTMAWDWVGSSAADEGVVFQYAFYSGVDTSDPIGDSDFDEPTNSSTAQTSALNVTTGDAVVAVGVGWGTLTLTNVTELDETASSSHRGAYGEAFPSAGTVAPQVTAAGVGGEYYATIAAMVINQDGSGSPAVDANTQMAGSEFTSGKTLSDVRAGQRLTLRTHLSNIGTGAIESSDELGLFYDRGDGYWSQVGYAKPPVTANGSGCASTLWTCSDLADTSDFGEYSSIAFDPSGRPWMAYYDNASNDDLVVAQYVGSGGSGCASGVTDWTCTTVDDTDTVGMYASIAIDDEGYVWVSYHDDTNGDLMVAEYVKSGGSGCASGVTDWTCTIVDSSVADVGEYTSIAIDDDGSPWISYYDSTNANLKVAQYVSTSGSCTSTAWDCSGVDTTVTGGQYTSIAFGDSNNPWVSYYDTSNTALKTAEYVGSGGNCDDTAWSCTTVDATNAVGTWASVAIAPDGNPWISYSNDTSDDLKTAEYVGSGGNCDDTGGSDAWQCTGVETTSAAGEYTSIAFAPDGNAWVSYKDDTSDDLYIARYVGSGGSNCDSSAWECLAVQTTNDTGAHTSIAFAPDGNAWVSYQYVTGSDVRIARVDRGGEIFIAPSVNIDNGDSISESHADMISATDTANRDDADCLTSSTWNNGAWFEAPIATGLSVPAGDSTTQCTEVTWMLDTSQAEPGQTYSFVVALKDAFDADRGAWRGPADIASEASPQITIADSEETTYSYSKAILGAFDGNCDDTDWECTIATSTTTQTGADLNLAFKPDGSAVIAQYDSTAGVRGVELVEYVGTGGSGCADAAWNCSTIETTGDIGENLSVVVGADGSPWISYAGSSGLAIARYVGTGGSCTDTAWECTSVDSNAGASVDSVIRVGSNGEVYVAYTDETSSEIWFAQYVGTGGSGCTSSAWSCEQVDSITTTTEGEGVGLVIDSEGIPWIGYIDAGASDDILVARYVGTGGSNCATERWDCMTVTSTGAVNAGASMTVDGDGDVWAAYSVGSSGGVYAAEYVGGGAGDCDDTDWDCTGIITGDDHFNPSIATDTEGNPWVSFTDDTGDDMYVARYVTSSGSGCTSSAWTCETVDSTSTQEVESSLAFDASGNPWVAYGTGSGTDFEISIARLRLPPHNLSTDSVVPFNGGINAGNAALTFPMDSGLSPATDEFGTCNSTAGATGYCGGYHGEGHTDSLSLEVDERPIYGFATSFDNNSQLPTGTAFFLTSLAPSSSTVVLQVYRHGSTNAWETIQTDSSSSDCSSESCVLYGVPSGSGMASEYFEQIDGRYWVDFRIYQVESVSASYSFYLDSFRSDQTSAQLRHGRVFRDLNSDPFTW